MNREQRRAAAPTVRLGAEPLPEEFKRAGLPVVSVLLPPELDGGGTIRMRKFTTRDYFAVRRRTLNDVQLVELTLSAIVEYLPGKDPEDLAPTEVLDVLNAWIDSKVEEVLPQASA